MDGRGRLQRGLAAPQRPRARLLLAGGEERDQLERLREPAHDLAERRLAAAAKFRRLLRRQLCELRLELEVDAVVTVDELEQRLRREGVELRWQLALPLRQRPAGVEVRKEPLEVGRLRLEARVPRLRLLPDPFEPPLDVVAVCHQQLELERLEVVGGDAGAGEPVEDDEERVHLPQIAEQLWTRPGNVDDAHGRRRDLPRIDRLGELLEPLVRDLRHPDVLLAGAVRLRARQRPKERRLARARQPDDAHLQRHAAEASPVRRARAGSASGGRRARGAGAT